MAFLKNTISLLAVFCVVPAAFAATARPSVMNTAMAISSTGAARRMPTVSAKVTPAASVAAASTTSSSSSSLMDNIECIDAYTECIKGDDSCGSDFSECTTNVLFHAQMPDCISTLAQCGSDGINSLFGTSDTTLLSEIETQNTDGEVTRYTYPTAGSVLGQMITAAEIENKYDTQTCVKRYMNCLHKDEVCGADFELCTSTKEFKKQALFCDSTLARCQSAGVTELLGKYPWSPMRAGDTVGGRIATEIENGADLAALNAVSTCYKVVDNCFVQACQKNPLRCIEGTSISAMQAAQGIVGESGLKLDTVGEADVLSSSQINRYLRSSCADTIGSNKYCHMTFLGKTPSKKDLADPDYIDEVFSSAHNDRKSTLTSKIQGLMQEFDKDAKDKCSDAIMKCAMRSCGGGSGAACYTQVFSSTGENTINGAATYDEIATGCSAIANTDPNCLYAYESVKNADYSYSYVAEDAFSTLFPKKTSASVDPIGLVAALNSSLSLNYNDAAIANMKKQCQSVATSCVKSLCGEDYANCYRNRTDIYSNLTNTGKDSFDKSMNKVGGVLDYTIVLGLCVDTVKNAPICEEHLAIEKAKYKKSDDDKTPSWGKEETVRSGWYDAGSATVVKSETETIQDEDENGNKLCTDIKGEVGICNRIGINGIYSEPVMISYTTYVQSQAEKALFRDLIYDLEKEAQAKYNAKLTKQQNDCIAANNGGIMGNKDIASTYMWAKLKNNKVPSTYPSSGLKPNQFVASNELYGSFCRIKVTLHSDDMDIMNALNGTLTTREIQDDGSVLYNKSTMINKDWATAYFAAGDAFTCGSWIPQQSLLEIANAVGKNARVDAEAKQPKIAGWMAALGAVGLGTGGMLAGDAIQGGSIFGGLNKKKANKGASADRGRCTGYATSASSAVSSTEVSDVVARYMDEMRNLLTQYVSSSNGSLSDATITEKYDTYYKEQEEWRSAVEAYKESKTDTDKKAAAAAAAELRNAINGVNSLCYHIKDDATKKDNDFWKQHGGQLVGGVVAAGAGAGLGYAITKSVQDAELDKAEQAAIQDFMDNVGSKIHCYIGSEEVGTFGDVISTSME